MNLNLVHCSTLRSRNRLMQAERWVRGTRIWGPRRVYSLDIRVISAFAWALSVDVEVFCYRLKSRYLVICSQKPWDFLLFLWLIALKIHILDSSIFSLVLVQFLSKSSVLGYDNWNYGKRKQTNFVWGPGLCEVSCFEKCHSNKWIWEWRGWK